MKDAELPCRRTLLLLALPVVAIEKLTDWLSADALVFEFPWIETKDWARLGSERDLVEMLFREQIANGTVAFTDISARQLAARCTQHGRRSLFDCLTLRLTHRQLETAAAQATHLRVSSARPQLRSANDELPMREAENALDAWNATQKCLLQTWI